MRETGNTGYNYLTSRAGKKFVNYWTPRFDIDGNFDESSYPEKRHNVLYELRGLTQEQNLLGWAVVNGNIAVFNDEDVIVEVLGARAADIPNSFNGNVITGQWAPNVNTGDPYYFTGPYSGQLANSNATLIGTKKHSWATIGGNVEVVPGKLNTLPFKLSDPTDSSGEFIIVVTLETTITEKDNSLINIPYCIKIHKNNVNQYRIMGYGNSLNVMDPLWGIDSPLEGPFLVNWDSDSEFAISYMPNKEGETDLLSVSFISDTQSIFADTMTLDGPHMEKQRVNKINSIRVDIHQLALDEYPHDNPDEFISGNPIQLSFPNTVTKTYGFVVFMRRNNPGSLNPIYPANRAGKMYELIDLPCALNFNGFYYFDNMIASFGTDENLVAISGDFAVVDSRDFEEIITSIVDLHIEDSQPGFDFITQPSGGEIKSINYLERITGDNGNKFRVANFKNANGLLFSEIVKGMDSINDLPTRFQFSLNNPATLGGNYKIYFGFTDRNREVRFGFVIYAANGGYYLGEKFVYTPVLTDITVNDNLVPLTWSDSHKYCLDFKQVNSITPGEYTYRTSFSSYSNDVWENLSSFPTDITADLYTSLPNIEAICFNVRGGSFNLAMDTFVDYESNPLSLNLIDVMANPLVVTMAKDLIPITPGIRPFKALTDQYKLPNNKFANKAILVNGNGYTANHERLGTIIDKDIIIFDYNGLPLTKIRNIPEPILNLPIIQPMRTETTAAWRQFWLASGPSTLWIDKWLNQEVLPVPEGSSMLTTIDPATGWTTSTTETTNDSKAITVYPIQQQHEDYYYCWSMDNGGIEPGDNVEMYLDFIGGNGTFKHRVILSLEVVTLDTINVTLLHGCNEPDIYNDYYYPLGNITEAITIYSSGDLSSLKFTMCMRKDGSFRWFIDDVALTNILGKIPSDSIEYRPRMNDGSLMDYFKIDEDVYMLQSVYFYETNKPICIQGFQTSVMAESLGYKSLYKPTVTVYDIDIIPELDINDIPENTVIRLPFKRKIGDRIFHTRSLIMRDRNTITELLTEGQFHKRPLVRLTTPETPENTCILKFNEDLTYFSRDNPTQCGLFLVDPTRCNSGTIQRIYHNGPVEPLYQGDFNLIGTGTFVPNEVNVIFVECVPTTTPNAYLNGRYLTFEYWYTK